MRKRCFNPRGQTVAEYALLIGVVIAALAAMQVYARRGIQAGVKAAADGLSPFGAADPTGQRAQVEGLRYESGERRNRATAVAGEVLERKSAARTTVNRTVQDQERTGGGRTRTIRQDEIATRGALGGGVSLRSEVAVEVRR